MENFYLKNVLNKSLLPISQIGILKNDGTSFENFILKGIKKENIA